MTKQEIASMIANQFSVRGRADGNQWLVDMNDIIDAAAQVAQVQAFEQESEPAQGSTAWSPAQQTEVRT